MILQSLTDSIIGTILSGFFLQFLSEKSFIGIINFVYLNHEH